MTHTAQFPNFCEMQQFPLTSEGFSQFPSSMCGGEKLVFRSTVWPMAYQSNGVQC